MNIYVLNGTTNYQIFPVPEDLTKYTVLDVPNNFNTFHWEVVQYNGYPVAVKRPPATIPFPIWDGLKWVTDKVAQKKAQVADAEATKKSLVKEAREEIIFFASFGDAGKDALKAWQDYYLKLIAIDTSKTPDIVYPDKPSNTLTPTNTTPTDPTTPTS